jgi:hypothetical protein
MLTLKDAERWADRVLDLTQGISDSAEEIQAEKAFPDEVRALAKRVQNEIRQTRATMRLLSNAAYSARLGAKSSELDRPHLVKVPSCCAT